MAGAVYVYWGSATGPSSPVSLTVPGNSSASAVAGAGDINGDGYADLVIAAADGAGSNANVYLGGAPGLSATPTVLRGPPGFALEVACAGDVNGDGYSDLAVNAPESPPAVYIYAGGTSGPGAVPMTLTGAAGSFFGAEITSAGDVNGDGFADLLVGASENPSFVFLGSTSGLANPVTLTNDGAMGHPINDGGALAGAGDVNGDGYADVVVGNDVEGATNGANATGAVFLYQWNSTGLNVMAILLTAPASFQGFGYSLALGW